MRNALVILLMVVGSGVMSARAGNLDSIGMTLLRATTTNLNGSGIRVGQPEAGDFSAAAWEVGPVAEQQPTNLFTWITNVFTTNVFPNSFGVESPHGDKVGAYFYGITNGIATNVAHVDNYEGNSFINYYIAGSHAVSNRIINQSFSLGVYNTSYDQLFDDYAVKYNILLVSGIDGPVSGTPSVWSPATCYNGIGVGSLNTLIASGPTPEGRSKPDICAPDVSESSYTCPQVSGAAAVLMQAAARGDGGNDTNSAGDIRTIKALLLNGATKTVDWTNSPSQPLHRHYGAGVLNVFNSYKQLAGGKHGYTTSTAVSAGGAHPPPNVAGNVSVLSGWDFTNIDSTHPGDGINHYFFSVTNSMTNAAFTLTATLVWNRQASLTNLDLFLYNANSNLVLCSTSLVDNVEHLYVPKLPQGRYDLQVWKPGGSTVSGTETYALAWEFFSQNADMMRSATNVVLSWPVYPAGFVVEWTTNLATAWTTSGLPGPTVTNNQNVLRIDVSRAGNTNQFFRLRRP